MAMVKIGNLWRYEPDGPHKPKCPKCGKRVDEIIAVDADDFYVENTDKPVVRGICRDCVRG